MIGAKTQKALLGDRPDLIEQVGPAAVVLYMWMGMLEHQPYEDWSWRADSVEGIPLVVAFEKGDVSPLGLPDPYDLLLSLRAGGWIYDCAEDGGMIAAVIGVRDRVEIMALEETLASMANVPVAQLVTSPPPEDVAPEPIPAVKRARRQKLKQALEETKAHTDERREVAAEKRRKRRKKKGDLGWATIGDAPHVKAVERKARKTKMGLYRLFIRLYADAFGFDPPNVLRDGRPAAGAGQLNHIVKDYGLDVAYVYVEQMVGRWDEVKVILGQSTPPVPGKLAAMRHDVCLFIQRGDEDPIASFRKEREEVRPDWSKKRAEQKKKELNVDEWDESSAVGEKEVGW
jgi:hypothetical protein